MPEYLDDIEATAADVHTRLLRVFQRQQLRALPLPPGPLLGHDAALRPQTSLANMPLVIMRKRLLCSIPLKLRSAQQNMQKE